jgi:hypothetical protein
MASIIKTDNIQKVSDDSNIIKKCGSTITIGSCGASVALASGATQTGFGTPSSSVLWCTTAKTSPFTAADKVGYFVNTSGGAVTVTLPSSPSAGDVVALKDYANTWDTNAVTLCNNGSKINGVCACAGLNTESQSVTLIYVDATKGWQDIQDSTSNVIGNQFIAATGGTITCCGNDRIHTFTSSGTFTVTKVACSAANNAVAYMVVAGGGYGSCYASGSAGGGGAGGFREGRTASVTPYTASPLAAACSGLTVTATSFPITVGAGSAAGSANGSPSVFSTITSTGGGRGGVSGGGGPAPSSGAPGGSGGAADGEGAPNGNGNTPPVSPSQGNNGGGGRVVGGCRAGGGGGGAGAVGISGGSPKAGGGGGAGVSTEITGSAVARAGGGGGSGQMPGGSGGAGGNGGGGAANISGNGNPGTANTGGGGGAGNTPGDNTCLGGTGGSGIVVIRYKAR